MKKRTLQDIALTAVIATVGVGAAFGIKAIADPEPTPTATQATQAQAATQVTEASTEWNCLTMGNKVCGPEWIQVSRVAGLADSLAEGETPDQGWEQCLTNATPTTMTVVCYDGAVYHL